MNREQRRKQIKLIANNVIKGRIANVQKKQFGFGLVITNRMVAIIFGPWAWTPIDRRRS